MQLQAEIGATQHAIKIKREGTRVLAEIDGRSYELEARPAVNGSYLLLHEGRVFDCLVHGAASNGEIVTVTAGGHDYAITLTDPRRMRTGANAKLARSGQLTAQMPGKVVRVMVQVGEEVSEGQPVLVVEAMKMQNEMKAAVAGKVTTLNVTAGDTVNAGDVLAVIE